MSVVEPLSLDLIDVLAVQYKGGTPRGAIVSTVKLVAGANLYALQAALEGACRYFPTGMVRWLSLERIDVLQCCERRETPRGSTVVTMQRLCRWDELERLNSGYDPTVITATN